MKNYTVTIGIPAYNEGKNIKRLLLSLVVQKVRNFTLEKILVISDGSTDNTVSEVLSIKNSLIELHTLKRRKGKSNALNKIDSLSRSDIVIHIDADILIRDTLLIERLIEPMRIRNADLSSARVKEYWTKTKFEDILKISMRMKKEIFEKYKNGKNIYTCHGRARALTRRLYKSIRFDKDVIAEDAYVYLYTVANGFTYAFAHGANIHYKLPKTLKDHQKQSVRFIQSYKQLEKEFGKDLIARETRLSKRIALPIVAKYTLRYPFTLGMYLGILLLMRIRSLFVNELNAAWRVATSSKGGFTN